MLLNDYVDIAFVVNLPARIDRKQDTQKACDAKNITVEFFPAVSSKGYADRELMIAGYQAQNQSYINLLTHCIKMKYKRVAIFQDDVEFTDDFEEVFSQSVEHDLPDNWDILYLGSKRRCRNAPISGRIYKVRAVNYDHAILLESTMFQPVIDQMEKMTLPADECLIRVYYGEKGEGLDNFKAYTIAQKGIAYQRGSQSDNRKKFVKQCVVD